VKESQVWEKTRHADWSQLFSGIASHWPLMLYLTALMTMLNFSSHGTQDMYPTFLEVDWHVTPTQRATMTAISMIGAICGGVLFGLISDKIGRRKVIIFAFIGALAMIPLWAFSHTLAMLTAGAFLIQFMVQGAWGVIPAHINELSPDSVRGFLPGFAYQCGVAIAGSIAYIEAVFARRMSYAHAMAMTAATVFTGAIIMTALGRERRGEKFGETAELESRHASNTSS
jgi:SHS family lactate transporter-like MFS transporter